MYQICEIRRLPDGNWLARFYHRTATGRTRELAVANLRDSMPRRELALGKSPLPPEIIDQILRKLGDREDN